MADNKKTQDKDQVSWPTLVAEDEYEDEMAEVEAQFKDLKSLKGATPVK